jgi:hypothetical protein
VVERLGKSTLSLFENPGFPAERSANSDLVEPALPESTFVEINFEYMEWFGTEHHHSRPASSFSHNPMVVDMNQQQFRNESHQTSDGSLMSGTKTDLDGLFEFGFDTSLPLMTNAFSNEEFWT